MREAPTDTGGGGGGKGACPASPTEAPPLPALPIRTRLEAQPAPDTSMTPCLYKSQTFVCVLYKRE